MSNFQTNFIFTPFVTSLAPVYTLNGRKFTFKWIVHIRKSHCFVLKNSMAAFYAGKRKMSEFQNSELLIHFVTSLTLYCTQNGPKLTNNTINQDGIIVLDLKIGRDQVLEGITLTELWVSTPQDRDSFCDVTLTSLKNLHKTDRWNVPRSLQDQTGVGRFGLGTIQKVRSSEGGQPKANSQYLSSNFSWTGGGGSKFHKFEQTYFLNGPLHTLSFVLSFLSPWRSNACTSPISQVLGDGE